MSAQRRNIHQLVHTLSYGDAISTEVIALQRALVSAGHSSTIFAIHVHPFYRTPLAQQNVVSGPIEHYSKLALTAQNPATPENTTNEPDEVVLHYSLGSPLNDVYRSLRGYKRSLIYHNLTPAKYFKGINPLLVKHLTSGAQELPELCALSDRLIADSQFNAADLKAASSRAQSQGVAVLPLLVEPSRFDQPANAGFAALLKQSGGINVLHVGRLVPNKGYEAIIRSFYFLRTHIDPQARLWLVGTDIDSELYGYALKRMCDAWGLSSQVEFLGQRSDDEVRALYENCSVYLCLSEHEGFCLPVIEAMHFGLPVISTKNGALAETIGDGGVLLDSVVPSLIAELIAEVAAPSPLREKLRAAGKARVGAFSSAVFSAGVAQLFGGTAHASAPAVGRVPQTAAVAL